MFYLYKNETEIAGVGPCGGGFFVGITTPDLSKEGSPKLSLKIVNADEYEAAFFQSRKNPHQPEKEGKND